jgi:hypothetical protein
VGLDVVLEFIIQPIQKKAKTAKDNGRTRAYYKFEKIDAFNVVYLFSDCKTRKKNYA